MSEESRSIDFAKTASIDMMSLNNKVVNMRQVVKRTKVHVINKLCKHITALKKKRGTEEQRTKNLRKAERFIEEIDSIKKLKEDKVSKYALASVTSFKDVSKTSLLAGPRALARLADHPLMQKLVTDFRQQHADWRDLAAYLLVKQTGRRFKTKKQKQKKLSRCVENINASETMTKAYIQERFGKEGLTKAEEKFERKRKRPKSLTKSDVQQEATDEEESRQKMQKNKSDTASQDESPVKHEDSDNKPPSKKLKAATPSTSEEQGDISRTHTSKLIEIKCTESDSEDEEPGMSEKNNIAEPVFKNQLSDPKEEEDSSETENSDISDTEGSDSEAEKIEQSDNKQSELQISSKTKVKDSESSDVKKKNECVVREFEIGAQGDRDMNISGSDDEDSEDSDDSSEGSDQEQNESDSNSGQDNMNSSDQKKKRLRMKKKNQVPDFLTKIKTHSETDPFFAGSGDDDDDEGPFENNEVNYGDEDFDAYDPSDDFGAGKSRVESVFYNPHAKTQYGGVSNRGSWDRKGNPEHFDRPRGRGMSRGRGRGRGDFQGRGRGRGDFHGRGRGRGDFHDRGRGRGDFHGRGRGSQHRGAERQWSGHGDSHRHAKFSHENQHDKASDSRFGARQGDWPSKTSNSQNSKGATQDTSQKEKLHPSWEASKKRKAEQSGLVAFKGRKITFDDD